MLYQDYKKKVNRFVRVLKFISKYKVAILSALTTILVLVVSFMITKGWIYGETLEITDIEYGNNPLLQAQAIFSDVIYEFSEADKDEWSKVVPTDVGAYKMRVVANGLFGKKYSDVQTFNIIRKKIAVSAAEDTVIYGESPSVTAVLAFTDKIACDGFVYENSTLATTNITPKMESIVIKNEAGLDVTSYYDITVQPKPITFIPREITVTVGSLTANYDGKPLEYPVATAKDGELVFGDDLITLTYSPEEIPLINIGSKVNNGTIVIKRGTVDVTHQYNITVIPGTLSLTHCPLIVEIGSKSFEYDGQTHSYVEFTYNETATPLPEGHYLGVNPLSAPTTVTNVSQGEVNNIVDVRVYNAAGEDVTSNFALTVLPEDGAKIWVTPKKVTIKTQDATLVYNGKEQTAEEYEAVGLIDGHELVIVEKTVVKNAVNDVENKIEFVIVDKNNNNADVTDNYDIEYIYGTINVEKKDVLFLSDSLNGVYNGQEQGANGFSYPDADKEVCQGHKPELTYGATVTDCDLDPESKGVENTFTVVIKDENGNVVTENYNVEKESGWLKLSPLPVKVITSTESKIYDGEVLKAESFEYAPGSAEFASGQTIKYVGTTEILNVLLDSEKNVTDCANEFELKIYVGEDDKTFNYIIEYEYGRLRVDKRPIIVTSNGFAEKTYYDGEKHRNDGTDAISVSAAQGLGFALVSGHNIAVDFRPDSYVEFARAEDNDKKNEFDVVDITDGSGSVIDNYDVSTVFGTLHLEKRPVQFVSDTLDAKDAEYDGQAHGKEMFGVGELSANNMGLVSGHVPHAGGFVSIVNVKESGTLNVFVVISITDAFGNEMIDNYEIGEYTYGTLNISPRKITLESGSGEKLYDGTALKVEGLSVGGGGMVGNHYVVGTNFVSLLDVAVDADGNAVAVDNTFDFEIYDGNTPVDKSNYEVTEYIYGKLKLNKRKITLTSQSAEKTYDDKPLSNSVLLVGGADGLALGQKVVSKNYAAPVDVLRDSLTNKEIGWTNTFDYEFLWNDGTPVSLNNYEVIKNETGLLTIYEKNAFIIIDSKSKEYDGIPLVAGEYGYTYGGLVDGHTLSFKLSGTITRYGTVTVSHNGKPEVYKGTEPKTGNYRFEITDGTLEVTKRSIIIKLREQSKKYDGEALLPLFDNSDVLYAYDDSKLGIASGDRITMYFDSISITEPGFVEIRYPDEVVGYIIKDGSGEDVTSCYEVVEYVDGSLEILKRKITIFVDGNTKEYYDGATVTSSGSRVTGFLYSLHDIVYAITGSQTDVGMSFATVEKGSVKITMKGTNEDASRYYDFEYDGAHISSGILEVKNKRAVTITTQSATVPYTGQAYRFETYVLTESSELEGYPMQRLESPRVIFTSGDMIMPGLYKNSIEMPVEFYIDGTNTPTTQNYDVTVIDGEISIGRIYIDYIKTSSATKEYDGTPLTSEDAEWACSSLPAGYEITVKGIGTVTEVGKADNKYKIELRINGVLASEAETENLVGIEPENITYGELEVTPIVIDITSADIDKWYYGEAPDDTWIYYTEWQDKNGFELDIKASVAVVYSIGPRENKFTATLNYNGVPVDEKNYVINSTFGTVTVYSRGISVSTDSGEFLYDGTPKSEPYLIGTTSGDIDDLHRAKGYNFNVTDFIDVNLEGYDNVCEVKVVDGNGNDMTQYYENIEIKPGKIVIKKRTLTIGVPSIKEKWEEGKEIHAENVMYDVNGDFELLNKDCYGYGVQYEYIIDCDMGAEYFVNSSQTQISYTIPKDKFYLVRVNVYTGEKYTLTAEEMERNFDLNSKEGILLLTDKLINIAVKDIGYIYSGKIVYYKNSHFRVMPGELPAGYSITLELEKAVDGHAVDYDYIGRVDVGSVDLDKMLDYLIVSKRLVVWYNGEDVTDDFVFKFTSRDGGEAVPLTISPCELVLKAGSKTEYYKEGAVLQADEYTIEAGEQQMLANGDKIKYCFVGGYLDEIGKEYSYILTVTIVNGRGDNVTSNYEIGRIDGTLEFVKNEQG